MGPRPTSFRERIDTIFQAESRKVFATLIRLLGDFDLAEDALHDAFAAAIQQWSVDGIPNNPSAWLVSTGRFKAIDAIRRRAKFDSSMAEIAERYDHGSDEFELSEQAVKDDQLRLIFTCCHPALPADARTALTLREVCGLTTEEIARAYLTTPPTVAQRIVRAKAKIRSGIPYQVPSEEDLPERLETALQVIYLLFNEGYYASSGANFIRADLSREAIRLGRLLYQLLPEPEVGGLHALMLLHESRRESRKDEHGEIVLLEDQDRSRWNADLIREGTQLVEQALRTQAFGPYTLQAAIAAVHAESRESGRTDWPQIAGLYTALYRLQPSPVVELNRAVAVAMGQGYEVGLAEIDAIFARGDLQEYALAHSAKADLLRRLERHEEAINSYRTALKLTDLDAERKFITGRLTELGAGDR